MVKTFFTNKETIKKILVALIIVITCNFILPCYSNVVFADINDQRSEEFQPGGTILKPIRTFLLFIGDAVMGILQRSFVTQQDVTILAKSGTLGGDRRRMDRMGHICGSCYNFFSSCSLYRRT